MIKLKRTFIINFCLIIMASAANIALAEDAIITKGEVLTIALKAVDAAKIGVISSINLETEDGMPVYVVKFTKDGTETDLKIDANSGEVIKNESDLTEIGEEESADIVEKEEN